ncbi:MAG: MerR family transcriptional regulator, partial [Acidaminococcaceae bacterium]
MENLKTIYFTPGELARYVGISKALLLYYDRENIFKPVTTDENGYRYYLAEQFFELQIVTNLRKLGLPLPEIKAYLANKNLKELENLLTVQNKELDRDIKLLQSKKRSLQKFAQELTNVHDVVLETPTVVALPKQFIEIKKMQATQQQLLIEQGQAFNDLSQKCADLEFKLLQKEAV